MTLPPVSPFPLWNVHMVEWSPLVANAIESGKLVLPSSPVGTTQRPDGSSSPVSSSSSMESSSSTPASTSVQFVFPDLPHILTLDDRRRFLDVTHPHQRIHTIAACYYTSKSSLIDKIQRIQEEDFESEETELERRGCWSYSSESSSSVSSSTILLVGGNEKLRQGTLTTVQAADILRTYLSGTTAMPSSGTFGVPKIWGVENPNDPTSLRRVEEKIHAGIQGLVTQPLLSTDSMDTFNAYYSFLSDETATTRQDEKHMTADSVSLVAGIALPSTAKNLQFWSKLLEQEQELQQDPKFQSHLAYFSQPYYTAMAWVGREIQDLYLRGPTSLSYPPYTASRKLEVGMEDEDDHETSRENHTDKTGNGSGGDRTPPTLRLEQDSSKATKTETSKGSMIIQLGVHFMPLKNVDTLCDVFRWIWR